MELETDLKQEVVEKLEQCILKLEQKNYKIAFAEGATNGTIQRNFCCLKEAEKLLMGHIVAANHYMKEYFFGIDQQTIETYGEESQEIAKLMAHNLVDYLDSDIKISVTDTLLDDDIEVDNQRMHLICVHIIFPNTEINNTFQIHGTQESVAEDTLLEICTIIIKTI